MNAAALRALPAQPDSRRLWLAVGLSIALHSAILALHFKFPEASRNLREKALDIILVNAKSASKPASPQALAQANLDGGGNTDEHRRAKTPLPPTRHQVAGNDIEQIQRRVRDLEAQQQKVLTQVRSTQSAASLQTGQEQPQPSRVSGLDLAESARAMARLEGEINKSVDEYNKRPRKKDIGTKAEAYRYAQYLEEWRIKVQKVGNLNYPAAARGKLYGAVVVWVELKPDGSLHNVEVARSSGKKILDEAALRIIRLAAPYGPFSVNATGGADLLTFARTMTFTTADTSSVQ